MPAEVRCLKCGGLNGAHGLDHQRFPQGGGGTNTPCPNTPVPGPDTHYFTIGVKYQNERHPALGWIADPQGWIEVRGCTEDVARDLVTAAVGSAWAFHYSADRFNRNSYPKGAFLVIDLAFPTRHPEWLSNEWPNGYPGTPGTNEGKAE